jgi:tRNA (guanine-N7-)-methyltransferase
MTKGKLKKFEEMEKFSNVLQPGFYDVFNKDHQLKGKWHKVYFKNNNPIILELGCGKGEYTVELAKKFKEKNFIGIDIKGARIWKGAKLALEDNIKNAVFLRARIEFVNSFFVADEVDEIWLIFPDPQPKKKKKRLTSARFLNSYKEILKTNGTVHLKTDSQLLYDYTMGIVKHNNLEIECFTDDLYNSSLVDDILSIRTYYENQFLEHGLKIYYLRFKLDNQSVVEEYEE